MAGKVKAVKGSVRKKGFSVSGKNLKEIWDDLKRNPLKSSDAVGAADTLIDVGAIKDFDVEDDEYAVEKDGHVGVAITPKKGEVTMTTTITLPELKSDKDLSDKAKKEWARFLKELSRHEDEHVAKAFEVAEEIADELSNLRTQGSGKDKKAAQLAAEKAFAEQYKKWYGGSEVQKRVKKAHDDFDGRGNTFKLDTSIE